MLKYRNDENNLRNDKVLKLESPINVMVGAKDKEGDEDGILLGELDGNEGSRQKSFLCSKTNSVSPTNCESPFTNNS